MYNSITRKIIRQINPFNKRLISFIQKENIRLENELKRKQLDVFEDKIDNIEDLQNQIKKQLEILEQEIMENNNENIIHPQINLDKELKFPYKLYGMVYDKEVKTSFMGDRIYSQHQIPKKLILNYLQKIYEGTLYSIAANDSEFLSEYLERNFADKMISQLNQLQEKGYKIEAKEETLRGIKVGKNEKIIDQVVIQGLFMEREKNMDRTQYKIYQEEEDMGLIICNSLATSDPDNFIDPKQNESMYDNYKQVVYRILVEIKSPLKLNIYRQNGEIINVDPDEYLWTHLVLFENQMIAPPVFKSQNKLETYLEWISKFKFGVWKMVDLDNFMLSNPILNQDRVAQDYQQEIFQKSSYDPQFNINIRKL